MVTLKNSAGTDIPLGKVTHETVTLAQPLFNKNIPGTSASTALNSAIFGRTRPIILTGRVTGSIADIKSTFLDVMNDWVDGESIGLAGTLTTKFGYDYAVICDDFTYDSDESDTNAVTYTISLIQGEITALRAFYNAINALT